jgi:hypothetical protein
MREHFGRAEPTMKLAATSAACIVGKVHHWQVPATARTALDGGPMKTARRRHSHTGRSRAEIMSALGHLQTLGEPDRMSALPPKADIG